MKRMPTPISAYFKVQPSPQKETALEMRGRILEIIPEATEIIKYGMPTFEVDIATIHKGSVSPVEVQEVRFIYER